MKKNKFISLVLISFIAIGILIPTAAITMDVGGRQEFLMAPPGSYCTITNPTNGDTVSGIVTIQVDAYKNPKISIDGVEVASGFTYDWDTTTYSDGSHTIQATAPAVSDTITVTVDNGGGTVDNPPVVTIDSPANGATVSDVITISVSVTDEDTLTPDIYIDGSYITTAFTYDWDTTTVADGSHTIYAEATDSASQTGSDEHTVTVDNSGGTTPTTNMPWWNDLIDAEVAHSNGITGEGSVVVIIDTGLGSNYVDMFPTGSILTSYCKSQTKELGYDNVDWNQDTEGHGTACTGTVIGYYLNGDYVQGVAPDAKIVMIRTVYWISTTGPPQSRVTPTDMLNAWADAINYARDLHANALSSYNMIISMSLGYTDTNTNVDAAIDAAEAEGIVVATSAGNDGHDSSTTGYPANYADATSVAAAGWDSLTGEYGLDGLFTDIPEGDFSQLHIADFSSGGKVDVTGIGENLILPMTDGYYYISGTSFSGPQVAGVYALMFQAHGTQTVQWLEDYMKNTCYWDSGYMTEFVWGAGFVQADAATV